MATLSVLLDNGANVNAQNRSERATALIRAVKYEDEAVVRLLVSAGARGDLPDVHAKTAFAYGLVSTDAHVRSALGLEVAPPADGTDSTGPTGVNARLRLRRNAVWDVGVDVILGQL